LSIVGSCVKIKAMIRTRFAPSPTGMPHLGHLRTCAYAYALAKHSQGDFVLRVEDTDRKRYVPEAVEIIKNMVSNFGMKWDEYYVQSERAQKGIYKKAAEKLVEQGYAFYCQCSARDAKHEGYSDVLRDPCRDKKFKEGAIKIRIPDNEKITYHDFVFDKDITWDSNTIFDATLLKSKDLEELPTYHLAATLDDHEMEITHVLRGYDWMPSTPIHLLVYKYLGYKPPEIGHLTDIQSIEGGKLSKRKGSTSIQQLEKEGYLKEAIFNFTILLGWAPKDNRELFSLEDFVETFDPKGFQKANPVFNRQKLDWFNGYYIRQKTDDQLVQLIEPFAPKNADVSLINQTIHLIKDRIAKLSDYPSFSGFFFQEPVVDKSLFIDQAADQLSQALVVLKALDNWNKEEIEATLKELINKNGWQTGDFFMNLRIAVTGSKFTPPITDSVAILGKEKTLERLITCLK